MPTQISVLISGSTRMHCDLLRKAFYSVRHRFQVVAFASSTVEILSALHENRPQVAVISSDLQALLSKLAENSAQQSRKHSIIPPLASCAEGRLAIRKCCC